MQIQELKIYSTNLAAQKRFYADKLGFTVEKENEKSISFRVGAARFCIEERAHAKPYHIAFHIPSQSEQSALIWLKARVNVLKHNGFEIQDFDFWNAKAIYFYDVDKNIMEFIAHRNLYTDSSAEFSSKSISGIAEIGMPTDNIEQQFEIVNRITGMEVFSGNFESFCTIGDEQGRLIVIDKNNRDWFPLNDKAHTADFSIHLEIDRKIQHLKYQNGQLSEEKTMYL